ncbi:LysR substrate-binding domain-containing protein [Comamonas thiooxydans]|uniref:LysR substrate-binding domain-containing protein n=1 Tax=Comamonas thiooxydans TaxID=363952 RepID=UPI003CFD9021
MEFRQLKYLVGIVEAGSLSRAAQLLHIAQPALSTQLARLEDELGTRLLIRSVRGVTPTEAGIAVYEHAKQLLRQVDATKAIAMQGEQGPTGNVAVGLPWTIASVIGLQLLKHVHDHLPLVKLEITEGPSANLAHLLAQGRLDTAVLFDGPGDSGLAMEAVVQEPLLLVGAAGSLDDRESYELEDIAQLRLLLLSRPNGIREVLQTLWNEKGITPKIVAEINSPSLLIDAVHSGLGYAILPACAMEDRLRSGDLDARPIASERFTRTVHIATSRVFAPTPAAEHVYGLLALYLRKAIEQGHWNARWIAAQGAL